MDEKGIAALIDRGSQAGVEILTVFDWPEHQFLRYLTIMQLLQQGLQVAPAGFEALEPALRQGWPPDKDPWGGHDPAWCTNAADATKALLELAQTWGPPPNPMDFNTGHEPTPTPTLTVRPQV
jgi:hypothetical protein